MALRNAPDGLDKAGLMAYFELEIASNLYDEKDLAELQARLLATRELPDELPEPTAE
jgi:hypothetical protein